MFDYLWQQCVYKVNYYRIVIYEVLSAVSLFFCDITTCCLIEVSFISEENITSIFRVEE